MIPGLGKIPWIREWLPTPVFLPGESHGQRSLVVYSSWGCKELDMTEHACIHVVAQAIKNLPPMQVPGFSPWMGKIPWRKE